VEIHAQLSKDKTQFLTRCEAVQNVERRRSTSRSICFDATSGKQVGQIVISEADDAKRLAGVLIAPWHSWTRVTGVGCEVFALLPNPFKQAAHVENHRDATDFLILCARRRIAQYRKFAFLEVTVSTVDAGGFAFAATAIS